MKVNISNIIVSIKKNQEKEIHKELEKNGISRDNIENLKYLKKSIDSRKKNDIKFIYTLEITLKKSINLEKYSKLSLAKDEIYDKRMPLYPKREIAVVGTGPAGLFSALRLAELGYIPIVFERGEEVEKRNITTDNFIKTNILNPNSNIQFGEGGAGTYSDGKLNTRIRSEYIEKVFKEFIDCGAQEEIFWNYKPHIGTDVLRIVVKNLREKIKSLGGKFHFNSLVEDIEVKNNEIKALKILEVDSQKRYTYDIDKVIFAIGHSSRDTYKMLYSKGVAMENKPFAIGVRIEH